MTFEGAELPAADFQRLFESGLTLNLVLKPNFTIVGASDSYLVATMTDRGIVGRALFDVFPDNPNDPLADGTTKLRASLERVLSTHVSDVMPIQKYDIRRSEADGGEFECRYWSPKNSPVFSADGTLAYILHQVADVTAVVNLEARQQAQVQLIEAQRAELTTQAADLRRANEVLSARSAELQSVNGVLEQATLDAQEANRLKSEFLANMSHELRTPLNSILGYTELVLRSKLAKLDERSLSNLNVVKKNGKHLLALINDILDLSKVESGKANLYMETFSPLTVVQAVMGIADPLAREKGIELVLTSDDNVGLVTLDETKVRQIVLNLVSNAIKFTRAGGIYVHIWAHADDRWAVRVKDTGIGIAFEHQALVFEAFRQVDASTTRAVGGTGLGLAIASKLARLLGGSLSLASQPGQGSTFTLELPRAVGEETRMPTVEPPKTESWRAIPSLEGKLTVVTINDDPEMLMLLSERLKDSPYVAVPATSGESGVQLVRLLKPFAVILDIILPNKDGWTVLHELKNDPDTSHIPVLILSVAENRMLGYSLGASGYLTKPVERQQLIGALDRFSAGLNKPDSYVLVIDADADARRLYLSLLRQEGLRSVEAEDGEAGVEAIEFEQPSLVILDLTLPHFGGFEVMDWLRAKGLTHAIPVIVITAHELSLEERNQLSEVQRVIQKGPDAGSMLVEELRRLSVADGVRSKESV